MKDKKTLGTLQADLSGLEVHDIEVFLQEGSRAVGDFAASCNSSCNSSCNGSCTKNPSTS